ncbi:MULTISPECIES: hypothetical protein [Microbacterium]|uniref:hypothetical protein n=1 Tax=Microbacterium TaxID=33882 RepID=UPI00277DB402|nr:MULTISPECIES: hypothetical protein [Microbacterium]MDQ1083100.1 hypothetical protein [Microbacterium sp. SORGH_AS_0344]MDQ1171629.1 hypothetical protein [Microbacterium proteolyticum]
MACCPRPTFDEITEWVAAYEETDHVAHATVHVLAQEDPEHLDSGIVAIHLNHGPASIYLNVDCDRKWTAALTERSGEFPLSGKHLIALGEELFTTGRLCEYLQSRTDEAAVTTA